MKYVKNTPCEMDRYINNSGVTKSKNLVANG